MRYTYPHTIDNGAGEQLTFVQFIDNAEGGMLEIENHVQPGGGPPMHVHYLQDESLTVVQGKIGAQVAGRQPTFHGPGETVTFLRGEVHRFWNAGEDLLICKGWAKPAHFRLELPFHPSSRERTFQKLINQNKLKLKPAPHPVLPG